MVGDEIKVKRIEIQTVACGALLACTLFALHSSGVSDLPPLGALIGSIVCAFNMYSHRRFLSRVILKQDEGETPSFSPVLYAFMKYPLLLIAVYIASLRGSLFLLSFLLGFLAFIPAVFLASRRADSDAP